MIQLLIAIAIMLTVFSRRKYDDCPPDEDINRSLYLTFGMICVIIMGLLHGLLSSFFVTLMPSKSKVYLQYWDQACAYKELAMSAGMVVGSLV